MDKYWEFRVFVEDRVDVIGEWLANLRPGVRADIQRTLAFMEVTRIWVRPYFSWLEGKGYENLGEILKKGSIQYRLIGCKGPKEKEFTLLIGSTKTTRGQKATTVWNPKDALKIAAKRSRLILEDRRYTNEYC